MSMPAPPASGEMTGRLLLRIASVQKRARQLREKVAAELPGHPGLLSAATGVGDAADRAAHMVPRLRRWFALHRLPLYLLLLGLAALGYGIADQWQRVDLSSLTDAGRPLTLETLTALLEALGAGFSILVQMLVLVIAMLGLELLRYRRLFNELNTLISVISMNQSNKQVLGVSDGAQRAHNVCYLEVCGDLLGLISALAGYYTQENPALLFNNTAQVIHQRTDGLRATLRAKISDAVIEELRVAAAAE